MRAHIHNDVLYLHYEDVPQYQKTGSMVRNTFFWALRSIADRSRRDQDWEYEASVWIALNRMLMAFAASGYLGYRETLLEFHGDTQIPEVLRSVSTWDSTAHTPTPANQSSLDDET